MESNCKGHTIEKAIAFDDTSASFSSLNSAINAVAQDPDVSKAMSKTFTFLEVTSRGCDAEVIEGISPKELEKVLTGRKLLQACRKGKHMWMELDEGAPALMFHFGMENP